MIFFVFCLVPSFGQVVRYAPDLRWDTERRAYVGVCNPQSHAIALGISGYLQDGTPLGTETWVLPGWGRTEIAAKDLFGHTRLVGNVAQADARFVAHERDSGDHRRVRIDFRRN